MSEQKSWQPDVSAIRVVVTGAASGMGEAVATELARGGAKVALADLNQEAIEATAAGLRNEGADILALSGDVADPSVVADWADRLAAAWGAPTGLVNCAGIWSDVPVDEIDLDEWQRVLDVNLTGILNTCRSFGAQMRGAGGGSVVNFTSLSGVLGFRRRAAYTAAKHAVIGLTRTLSAEWGADNVRVNAIGPGRFETALAAGMFDDPARRAEWLKRVPMARTAEPVEMVGPILFLLTPMSSYVSGAVLMVDGGFSAS